MNNSAKPLQGAEDGREWAWGLHVIPGLGQWGFPAETEHSFCFDCKVPLRPSFWIFYCTSPGVGRWTVPFCQKCARGRFSILPPFEATRWQVKLSVRDSCSARRGVRSMFRSAWVNEKRRAVRAAQLQEEFPV